MFVFLHVNVVLFFFFLIFGPPRFSLEQECFRKTYEQPFVYEHTQTYIQFHNMFKCQIVMGF